MQEDQGSGSRGSAIADPRQACAKPAEHDSHLPMDRRAACHCEQLVLACAGEPRKISLCHCLDCQRRTGSLFSVAAFFPREQITPISGEAKSFTRASASGFPVTFHFCPACGSTLSWEAARLPDLIGVAAGAFAQPDFPMPSQAVWTQDRHPWIQLPEPIVTHARNPEKAARKE
ncbi:GFA family protein [Sphingopyxis fribergensis]|uniref:GFA family protein n=1 Tax=Sphingopyxis fribergensis TaxID=1515612 RepID=UPI001E3501E1|nr:GFA family protein [Sphingopyxis fribergensis]